LAIRNRLQDGDALKDLGLTTYRGMEIAGTSILLRHLFSAARKITSGEPADRLRGVRGGEARLTRSDGGFILAVQQGERVVNARVRFLAMVSVDRSERLEAFDATVKRLGPTSDFSAMRAVVEERPFSDEEMETILDETSHGVEGVQSQLRDKLRSGRATLKDLVPGSLEYYEKFCGPAPGNVSPEEYVDSILPAYRKELLRRDLRKGLEICLLGSLRSDLCPGPWVGEIDDHLLWVSLVDCLPDLDPISLLASLDLALYRLNDERFRAFADDAVRALVKDEFLRPYGGDAYRMIPLLARFVLNQINVLDGGALRPPFWKRMCAWMQATLVARLIPAVDVDSFSAALLESMEVAGEHANTLDLRREPMLEAGSTAASALRREIVGRLVLLPGHHPAGAEAIPGAHEIEQACARLQEKALPWSWLLPGPLEGHRRPGEDGKFLPEELMPKLRELPGDRLIGNLANLSQLLSLGEEMKELLRSTAPRELMDQDLQQRLVKLLYIAMIAAAERDASLAQMVAEGILRLAPELEEEQMIAAAVEAVLRAAAAFEDEATWSEWLERQFLALAGRIPPGVPARMLWYHIRQLEKVTRLELGIFRRAEGAASAAAV
jgi:hypothetical protein